MQIQIFGYSNIGTRQENQDCAKYGKWDSEGFYAILADGLGGHGGGRQAAQLAVSTMLECAPIRCLPSREEITGLVQKINRQILSQRVGPTDMKTTLVCLFVCGGRAVWVHIGDSRLYHYYDGFLAHYTLDHSVCQLSVRLGEITRHEIPGHPDRNRLLRVLGESNAEPDIFGPIVLEQGEHAFFLCSDGLWERLVEEEIMLDLQKSPSPQHWIDCLRRRAEKRKYQDVDNNTAIAAMVKV